MKSQSPLAAYDSGMHLNIADIMVDSISNPTLLKFRVKASETDPFHRSVEIFIGRTNNKLCSVSTVLAYLAKRGCHSVLRIESC